jgi:hypothetical protein
MRRVTYHPVLVRRPETDLPRSAGKATPLQDATKLHNDRLVAENAHLRAALDNLKDQLAKAGMALNQEQAAHADTRKKFMATRRTLARVRKGSEQDQHNQQR